MAFSHVSEGGDSAVSIYYLCFGCSQSAKKVFKDQDQHSFCLNCFDKMREQSCSLDDALQRDFSAVKLHSPVKGGTLSSTNTNNRTEPLQGISESFFVDLKKRSIQEGLIKIGEILECKKLLCLTQEAGTYALVKRTAGHWTYGVIVKCDTPNTIKVCVNFETNEGKYVQIKNSLMIPASLMTSIDSSQFSNGVEDLDKLQKSFTFANITMSFSKWTMPEDND